MWESMMGKSITRNVSFRRPLLAARALSSAHALERRHLDRQLFQSAAHALQRRRLHGLDALEILKRFVDARARDNDEAVAIADYDSARGDRHTAADDRQADRARSAPLRRIWRDAHGESRKADGFEVVEVAHKA